MVNYNFFVIFLVFTVTGIATSWPCNWVGLLSIEASECSSKPNPIIPGPSHPEILNEKFNSMTFRLINGDVFFMGSNRNDDEKPQDAVAVKDFYLGIYEVSRSQYKQFADATGRDFIDTTKCTAKNCPMSYITWEDAVAYCKWLSDTTGHTYRLPSEAEWEYAARGGNPNKDDKFWWGNTVLDDHENWQAKDSDRDAHLAPVDFYKANKFGLYNMLGNVSEWTQDCYKDEYRGIPRDSSAYITNSCNERVIRGGNYVDNPDDISVTRRGKSKQTNKSDLWGFRVARQIEF